MPTAWPECSKRDRSCRVVCQDSAELLVANRMEPWGQAVTRFLGPAGLLVGITRTPWMRD